LLRAKASQVILRVRKHPKDLLPFSWDAVPNEVRDAVPSEARDASLTLGRTKMGARQDKVEGLLVRTDGVERNCDQKAWLFLRKSLFC